MKVLKPAHTALPRQACFFRASFHACPGPPQRCPLRRLPPDAGGARSLMQLIWGPTAPTASCGFQAAVAQGARGQQRVRLSPEQQRAVLPLLERMLRRARAVPWLALLDAHCPLPDAVTGGHAHAAARAAAAAAATGAATALVCLGKRKADPLASDAAPLKRHGAPPGVARDRHDSESGVAGRRLACEGRSEGEAPAAGASADTVWREPVQRAEVAVHSAPRVRGSTNAAPRPSGLSTAASANDSDDVRRLSVPPTGVCAFLIAALARVLPAGLIGGKGWRALRARVARFVTLRRFETLSLHAVQQGMPTSGVPWLHAMCAPSQLLRLP
jgi:Telomerase ribonucleoprotein complex - RNA binding domain